jgi:hypothetical protein
METFRSIRAAVDNNGGLLTIEMEKLRRSTSAKKLGRRVCEEISERLKSVGLEHLPAELAASGSKLVLLCSPEFDGWDVIRALLNPSRDTVDVIRERIKPAKKR